jgi:hypothetical protein
MIKALPLFASVAMVTFSGGSTPFPCREGGTGLPSPLRGGAGGGVKLLVN